MKALACLIFGFIFSVTVLAQPRIVAITGSSDFEYPAEMIRIKFSVFNKKEQEAAVAKSKVESASTEIVRSLMALGIKEKDIVSPSFTLDLDGLYDEKDCVSGYVPVVGRDMEVLVRDIKLYTKVIDALIKNGATSISDISSEVVDIKKYEQKAMMAAIEDARYQAKFLVENLGGKLGRVYSIGDKKLRNNGQVEEVVVTGARRSVSKEDPYAFQPLPVEISAEIYVEFEIE